MTHQSNKIRVTDLGTEKLCTSCNEWWPADTDFFHAQPSGVGGLFYCCKACYFERFRPRRTERSRVKDQQPCAGDDGLLVLAKAMAQIADRPNNIVFMSGAVDAIPTSTDRRFWPVQFGAD